MMKQKMLYLFIVSFFILITPVFALNLTNGLFIYYSFDNADLDGSNNPYDLAGYDQNGTNLGATPGVSGKLGECFRYNHGASWGDAVNTSYTDVDTWNQGTANIWINANYDPSSVELRIMGDRPASGQFIETYLHRNGWIDFTISGASTTTISSSAYNVVNQWVMLTLAWNSSHMTLYLNGSEENTSAGLSWSGTGAWMIGAVPRYTGITTWNGTLDEFGLWNRSLNSSEVLALYNGGVGLNYTQILNESVPEYYGVVDVIFQNESNISRVNFSEGENFYTYVNYTDQDGNAIGNDTGVCNVTFENAIEESVSGISEETLCDFGCDYDSYSYSFSSLNNDSSLYDVYYGQVCHLKNIVEDLNISIVCASGSDSVLIPKGSFPKCSLGLGMVSLNSSVCKDDDEVNITLNNGASGVNQAHNVSFFNLDRYFSNHTHSYSDGMMEYDPISGLWAVTNSRAHKYYEHDIIDVWANCSVAGNISFLNSTLENVTIINVPPVVIINQVLIDGIYYNLSNGINLYNVSGVWNWLISVSDTLDLDVVNFTFYDNASAVIQSNQYDSPVVENTSDSIFLDFNNSYNLSVWANDSYGDFGSDWVIFNVLQVPANESPNCSVGDSFVFNDSSVVLIVFNCSDDEGIDQINVTCVNNDNGIYLDDVNVSSYNFSQNLSNPVNGDLCVWVVSDHIGNVYSGSFYLIKESFVPYGSCPNDSVQNVLMIAVFILIGIFMINAGVKYNSKGAGLLGSLCFMVIGWFLAGCSALIGLIVGAFSIVSFIGFVFRK